MPMDKPIKKTITLEALKDMLERYGLTYHEREILRCVLMSAIYDCQNRIAELKSGDLSENYKREQLQICEQNIADYNALLEKIRRMD